MGVKNLWTLLSAQGYNQNIKYLRGKRLAIDVSIWLVKFSAISEKLEKQDVSKFEMRTFLKRIVKMLIAGIEPVFVFEGKPPGLKSDTLLKRKVRLLKSTMNYKKVAEKFIIKLSKKNSKSAKEVKKHLKDLESVDVHNIDDSKLNEINELLREFEEVYESEERKDQEIRLEIMVKQNREYILDHGMTVEEFKKIPEEIQQEFIKAWKEERKAQRRSALEKINTNEEKARLQFQNYIEDAHKAKDLQQFKTKLGNQREDSEMKKKNFGFDVARRDLIFRQRVEWDRDKIMYVFRKQDKQRMNQSRNRGLDDEIFKKQKKRLKYLTKKQKLDEIEKMKDKIGSHLLEQDQGRSDFIFDMLNQCSKMFTNQVRYTVTDEVQRQKMLEKEKNQLEKRKMLYRMKGSRGEEAYNARQKILEADETYNRIVEECGSQGLDDLYPKEEDSIFGEHEFDKESIDKANTMDETELPPGKGDLLHSASIQTQKQNEERQTQLEDKILDLKRKSKSSNANNQSDESKRKSNYHLQTDFVNWLVEEEEFLEEELPFLRQKMDTVNEGEIMAADGPKKMNIFEYFAGGFEREPSSNSPSQPHRRDSQQQRIAILNELIGQKETLRISTGASQGRIHSKDGSLKNESHAHLKLMLELFGIPWINSPGEAEAQCARLEVRISK